MPFRPASEPFVYSVGGVRVRTDSQGATGPTEPRICSSGTIQPTFHGPAGWLPVMLECPAAAQLRCTRENRFVSKLSSNAICPAAFTTQPSMPSLPFRGVESSAALRPLWRGDNLALAMLIGTEARGAYCRKERRWQKSRQGRA
jgi:hypothetical protein